MDLIYKAKQEHLLINIMLSYFGYNEDDNNVLAYSRVSIAYLIFDWCNEWYKRGMVETPEEMARLFEQAKNNGESKQLFSINIQLKPSKNAI